MIERISLASPILNLSILKLGPTRLIISSMCGVNVNCQSRMVPSSLEVGLNLMAFALTMMVGWLRGVFGVPGHTRARLLPRGQIIKVELLAIG